MDNEITVTELWPVLKFFKYDHLPKNLQYVSKPFHDLAHDLIVGDFEHHEQIYMALVKLLEAKDCAVRAHLKA